MNLLPYRVDQTLAQLQDERMLAEDEGDAKAIAAIDKCIAEWLTSAPERVTSYIGLIKSAYSTAEECDKELARIKEIKQRSLALAERLESNAMATMNRYSVRELKAKPGGGLQIRGNGGLQPLEIPEWPKDSSGRFVPLSAEQLPVPMDFVKTYFLPHTERLRETLGRCVPCPQCGKMTESEIGDDVCFTCNGERTIPATVPGARLLERGEHLRVL